MLKTPFFMKSKNITFPVMCINPDFLPEVSDFLRRKQEAFVWTKHLRFENTERGRESESNRGAFGSQRASLLLSLRDRSEIQHTKVSSHMHSRSQKWEQPKHPAREVNKLWSTHTAAACCMSNKKWSLSQTYKTCIIFKRMEKKIGDFVWKKEKKRREGNIFECQEWFSLLFE